MKERETYIDTIRILLTVLVILHHAAITYGGPGNWYYAEPVDGFASGLTFMVFVSVNQAFFMGFFFFLSSYFIPASYKRKGGTRFMLDRVKRLGIPILFYSFILTPIMIYMLVTMRDEQPYSWTDAFFHRKDWISVGVLWFTTALLLFTMLYWIGQLISNRDTAPETPMPTDRAIFFFAIGLGAVSFLVRIIFPIGWTLSPVGFQFAHFTQYIALFIMGIVAHRNGWLAAITYEQGKRWLRLSALLIVVGFPSIYMFKIVTHAELDVFLGGFTIHSLINALWEQLLGIALIMAWLGVAKHRWKNQGRLGKEFSRAAYAVYIVHPVFLVLIALLLKDVHVPSLLKFVLTGSLAVAASLGAGSLLVRTPVIKEVV
jgi:hypothetical protein